MSRRILPSTPSLPKYRIRYVTSQYSWDRGWIVQKLTLGLIYRKITKPFESAATALREIERLTEYDPV